jgi:hypothetical protein
MSEIREMNKEIRVPTRGAAILFSLVAASAIVPGAAIDLAQSEPSKQLWWSALSLPFVLLTLVLEGFEVGRNTKHRNDVNDEIVTTIIRAICSKADCPQVESPSRRRGRRAPQPPADRRCRQ